jgi:hypothetical protein
VYFGREKPTEWAVELPRAKLEGPLRLKADVIDTWDMTITPVPGEFDMDTTARYRMKAKSGATIPLPGKPYMAIRLRAVK